MKNDFSWVADAEALECAFLVWGVGFGTAPEDFYQTIVATDRKGFCFFYPFHPGMLLPAAKILQQRAAEAEEADKGRRLTRTSLLIAGIALGANVIWNILKEFVFPLLMKHPPNP
jgi:hypothetical protein